MKTNKTKNTYVQPACQVFQVQLQQIIATSNQSTQNFGPGNFGYGGSL